MCIWTISMIDVLNLTKLDMLDCAELPVLAFWAIDFPDWFDAKRIKKTFKKTEVTIIGNVIRLRSVASCLHQDL